MAGNRAPLVMMHVENGKKEQQIIELCRRLSFQTRQLKQADLNVTVGVLAGIGKGGAAGNGAANAERAPKGFALPEILVFSGLSDEKQDLFLEEYRKVGVEPIGLKAVVTPYNMTWNLYQLVVELMRERTSILLGIGNR